MGAETNTINLKIVIDGKESAAFVKLEQEEMLKLLRASDAVPGSIKQIAQEAQLLEARLKNIEVGSDEFKRMASELDVLNRKLDSAHKAAQNPGMADFTQKSANARMAVTGLSQGLGDAVMFQNGFRSGMMSIGNNLDFVVQALVATKVEAQAAGMTMKQALVGALTGPTGILLAISAVISLMQILPLLFRSTSKAAEDAAENGIKKFSDSLKTLSPEQLDKLGKRMEDALANAKRQLEEYRKSTTVLNPDAATNQMQKIGITPEVRTSDYSQAQERSLKDRVDLMQKLNDANKEQVESARTLLEIESAQKNLVDQNRAQKNSEDIKYLNDLKSAGVETLSNGRRVSDALAEAEREQKEIWKTSVDRGRESIAVAQEKVRLGLLDEAALKKLLEAQLSLEPVEAEQLKIKQQILEIDNKRKQQQLESSKLRTENAKAEALIDVDIEEKRRLAFATTEAERIEIQREAARKRIEVERDYQLKSLALEEAAAKLGKSKSEQSQITEQFSIRRTGINNAATSKLALADSEADSKQSQDEIALEQAKKRDVEVDREREQNRTVRDMLKDKLTGYKAVNDELMKADTELARHTKAMADARTKAEYDEAKAKRDATQQRIDSLTAEKIAKEQAVAAEIASGVQGYSREKSLGSQMAEVTRAKIKAMIAEAVAGVVSKELASLGPLGLILAPALGVAASAMMDAVIPKFASGGFVSGPGGPRDDRIPALLSNGEFIVNAEAARSYAPELRAINNMTYGQTVMMAGGVSNDAVVREIRELTRVMKMKREPFMLNGITEPEQLVRENLSKAERYIEERRK